MIAYTANLTITANTAWDTWYSFSDRACHDTATAYRWYVNTFFSAKSQQIYETIGEALGHLMIATILVGAMAGVRCRAWAEAEVAAALPPNHIADASEMVEADPFSPAQNQHYPAMPATVAAPVVTRTVKAESKAKQPTTAELRKRCIAHNQGLPKDDPRYIRNAARLTKAQALKALGIA